MNTRIRTMAMTMAMGLMLGAAVPRAAGTNGLSVEVLVNGQSLAEYRARNTTYIEAQKNQAYSIRLTNHTGKRVAVALAVDGINTINGERTTAFDGSKWVLGPWESVTLDGWQTSGQTARRFLFTTEKKSYGAYLGETANLGNITAVMFRERPRPPVVYNQRPGCDRDERSREDDLAAEEPAVGGASTREPSSQPAPSGPAKDKSRAAREQETAKADDLSDAAATGMGGEVDHQIERVYVDLDPNPVSTVVLRYEYRPELVKLGVLPKPKPNPLPRREQGTGFDDMAFCREMPSR